MRKSSIRKLPTLSPRGLFLLSFSYVEKDLSLPVGRCFEFRSREDLIET